MEEDGITPNAQTFAAIFECIEKSVTKQKPTVLEFYNQKMQEKVKKNQNLCFVVI